MSRTDPSRPAFGGRAARAVTVSMLSLTAATAAVPEGGEELTYSFSWKGLEAGTATIKIVPEPFEGVDAWSVVVQLQSASAIDYLYPVRDTMRAWVERASLMPLRYEFHLRESDKRRRQTLQFDRDAGRVRYEVRKHRDGEYYVAGSGELDEAGAYLDPASLFLAIRRPAADRVAYDFVDWGKIYQAVLTPGERGRLETFAGEIATREVSFELPDAEPGGDAAPPVRIWVTDDDRRLPVRFEADSPLGSIVGELTAATPAIGSGR